eukprot:TRINITY_DN47851_c0_g2_i1.p1 TRINITY_DN47851_c0_g2~~TRINITY_DN47851_c0_g2_i1.p1  ORF type:complete len:319 (+),score=49.24 TRINITY_DN47851_c0_g2_i1:208-1164(+)
MTKGTDGAVSNGASATNGVPAASEIQQNSKMNYIVQHKIYVLFEQLAGALLTHQPKDPIPFLMDQLQAIHTENQAANPPAEVATTDKEQAAPQQELMKVTLAVFGLDQAGKTTLISAIGGEVDPNCAPTVGFSPSHFQGEHWDLRMFDLGGGHKFRGIWKQYFSELHAIIFVVDAADESRFEESKEALWGVLNDDRASEKPLLVFANKQDKSTAKTSTEVEAMLGIKDLPSHYVFGCSAIADPVDSNIEKGMEWVLEEVTTVFKQLQERIDTQLAVDKARRKQEMEEQKKRVAEYRKQWDKEAEEKKKEKEAEGKDAV